ncbi:hypothetical protein [Candidatus Amarolinea aalborgensis]|jgi:hypothetical protein|uniref:hypothetical protein n=1 Tax=Candidatus Amarolinea aalborgensis TaxID=2249329 RepID=UPI003BF9B929
MNDGVVLWLQGLPPAEAEALMATLTDGAWWTTEGAAVCALAPQPGEHLSAGVNRALNTAIMASQRQAAVGLAVGPLPVGGRANPTLERARRAAALAAGGDVILAWGSQAYLMGEFESVSTGFVKLLSRVP